MNMMHFFLMGALVAVLPAAAYGATLSLEPATSTLAVGQEVIVSLLLRSDTAINTIGTAVILPAGLEFREATKGTVIQDWVDQPAYDPVARSLTFSGIVPGGWRGTGTLLALTVRAQEAGSYTLTYDALQTEVYRNDGRATPEPVVFGTIGSSWPLIPPLLGAIVATIILLWWFFKRQRMHIRFV